HVVGILPNLADTSLRALRGRSDGGESRGGFGQAQGHREGDVCQGHTDLCRSGFATWSSSHTTAAKLDVDFVIRRAKLVHHRIAYLACPVGTHVLAAGGDVTIEARGRTCKRVLTGARLFQVTERD